MLTFALAVFLLIVTPGPGVLSAAGVGSAYGLRDGVRYVAGLFVGTNLVALAVVSGLAAVVLAQPQVRLTLLLASGAYLLYLAFRIAFAGSRIAFITAAKPPGFVGGLLLQAVNPKAYAVNTALFTGFAFWPASFAVETLLKFAIMNAIWIPLHLAWLAAGISMHQLNLAPRTQSAINIAMALAMLAVVGLAAFAPH